MIDSILNLLFRCSHRRLTRPFSPIGHGVLPGEPYVVCLDCGKQFAYDLKEMRTGKPIDPSHHASVVPADLPMPHQKKLKYAFWAAVPVAVFLGAALRTKKPAPAEKAGTPAHPKSKEAPSGSRQSNPPKPL